MNPAATQMISGCGPGAGVPADTKQEGVRGERRTKIEILNRAIGLCDEMSALNKQTPIDWAAKSRIHQQLADAYAALAKGE